MFWNEEKFKRSKGFTLIELLVVIAIIGILASIILASLSSARAKGRDAKRLSDIKQIQLALELFYDACGNYPLNIYVTTSNTCGSASSGIGLVANGYISAIPTDPSYSSVTCSTGAERSCYSYVGLCGTASCTVPTSYHLGTSLETPDSSLSQDSDACPGTLVNEGTTCGTGQGRYDMPPTGGNWVTNANSGQDFSGLSYAAGGSWCNSTAGNPYSNTVNQETCYDVTP